MAKRIRRYEVAMQADRFLKLLKPPLAPPSAAWLWAGGIVALQILYMAVFMQTTTMGWGGAFGSALSNVLPLAALAALTHGVLRDQVMPRGVGVQIALHAAAAPAFSVTWYALIVVGQGFARGWRGDGFVLEGFSGPAFTWQAFQGLILYGMVAAVCYAIRGGRGAATLTIVDAPPLERYLTRTGDEIVPVDVREIVSITGAQDYAEVATVDGRRHLVRMSLNEFERRLDATRFLRVHRSTIVAFAHLARAEPAGGGRMLAHLVNGDVVQVSRAGGQLLRSFIV